MAGASVRSGSWLLLDTGSAALIAFAFFIVCARVMDPRDFGIAALVLSVSQVAVPMIESLFHDAIVQREDLDERDVATASTVTVAWALLLAAAVILIAEPLGRVTNAPELAHYLPWLGFTFVASGLAAVPAALARRRMEFRSLAVRTIVARIVATAIGLTLLFTGWEVWGMIAQSILSVVFASVLLLALMRPSLRPGIAFGRLKPLLTFAGAAMGAQALMFAGSRLVLLIVSAILGPVAAGTWTVALRFVEPLQIMAATTVGQFMLPITSRRQTDAAALKTLYLAASRRVALVLVPMFLGLAACSGAVIELFAGPQWTAAAGPMAVISIVFAIIASRQLVEIVLTSVGAPHLNLVVQATSVAISLVGVAALAPLGVLGGTIGWSLRALPFVTIAAVFLQRRADIPVRAQFAAIAPAFAAGTLMSGLIVFVGSDIGSPVARLAVSIPLGVLAYGLCALALDRHGRADAAALVRWLRRRGAPS